MNVYHWLDISLSMHSASKWRSDKNAIEVDPERADSIEQWQSQSVPTSKNVRQIIQL